MRQIVTDFKAGELAPALRMRVDSKAYPSGSRSLKNCIIANTGGVSRRPGTFNLADYTMRVRLAGFEFDDDEKYILGFGVNYLAIHDETGTLITSFSGSTDCPWDATTRLQLTYAQAGDVMIITHKLFKTKVLTRTGLTTFVMSDFAFQASPNAAEIYQPYVKFAAASVTLALSAISGAGITVTASSAHFTAAYVGLTIRVHGVEITITGYTSSTVVTGTAKKTVQVKLDPSPFRYTDGSDFIEVTHAFHGLTSGVSVTVVGAADSGGIVKANVNGARTVTVIDEDHYTIQAAAADVATDSIDGGGTSVYIQSTAATRDWDEQVFSAVQGYPQAVCFHEDRLWFGGSLELPDFLCASCTGEYYNFDVGEGEDSKSIQTSIGSTRVANIRHLISNRVLQIYTEGAEFVAKQTDGSGLTPGNIAVKNQTVYGSSYLRPRVFDGATLFLQFNQKTVREFIYQFNEDGFQSNDVSTLSPHLINTPIAFDVSYGSTTRPEQYAFFVNTDGTMAVFHSIRNEGLAAWVPWATSTGHTFDSVLTLGNKVFCSVLRAGTYRLERFDMDGTNLMDFAKSMSGASTVTWALGAKYASLTVKVVSGNYYLGEFTANGAGTIVTNDATTSIVAGLDYEWQVVPNAPDRDTDEGPTTGRRRRISSVVIHMMDTLSLSIDNKNVVVRNAGISLSDPPTPLSAKYKYYMLGYDRDPIFILTQGQPLPVTILGFIMEVKF